MDLQWTYGVAVRREEDGQFHAYAPAMPDAIASGEDETEAFREMGKALVAAVRGRIKFGLDLEPPPPWLYGDKEVPYAVRLPAELATKATVYILWRASGMSKVALAERMAIHEREVRRVLDPDHATGLDRMDEAARVFGHQLVVGAVAA
jgi:antitoxin HicB